MNSSHTPGPWRVERFKKSQHARIQPATGIGPGGSLADVYGNEANAHLMAAGPELLSALKELYAIMLDGMQGDYDDMTAALGRARAAISKAESR